MLVHRYGPHIFHTNADDGRRLPVAVHRLAPVRAPRPRARRRAAAADPDQPHDDQRALRARPADRGGGRGLLRRARASRSSCIEDLRGRRRREGRPRPLREVLPRLHAQAVGARPVRAARLGLRAHPDPHEHRRPLLHRHASRRCRADGYTAMFERILDHPSIEVRLGTDFDDVARRGRVRPPRLHRARSTSSSTTASASCPTARSSSSCATSRRPDGGARCSRRRRSTSRASTCRTRAPPSSAT